MREIPILSNIWNFLTAPSLPGTSLEISETHLAMITLRSRGREFEARNLGVVRLPAGLVRSSFTEPNIADEPAMVEVLRKTATQAGMNRVKKLGATLPAGSARSLVISLDNTPASRAELAQMMEWKVERGLGHKFGDLRVSYRRLRDFNGRSQWIASAVFERVVDQYERIFKALDWQIGLISPQHMGEAQWLMRSKMEEDQVVVSLNERGFDAVIVRGDEPILVREVNCPPEERENEFYRLMVFYRDRLSPENAPVALNRMLTIGKPEEQLRFREVLTSALEQSAISLNPQLLGLRVDPNAPFHHFAAAGGLATMAWR
jgi:Tfp pilus assembly PilM family ATPase